jgi:hypothetical protein
LRAFAVPEGCDVHVDPVGDVRMVPPAPTATNCVVIPDQVTPARFAEEPEVCDAQVTPSEEVMMVPIPPTAANCVPDQETPRKSLTTENEVLDVTIPPGAVTLNGPLKLAMGGMVMLIWVVEAMLTGAVTPLIVTVLLVENCVPVMETAVPGDPLVGAKPVIDGAGVTGGGGRIKVGELSHHCFAGGIFQNLIPNVIRLLQPLMPPGPEPRFPEVPDGVPAGVKFSWRHCGSPLQMK